MAVHIADTLDDLAEAIYDNSENKGFWEEDADHLLEIPRKLALVVSEVVEALDVHRDSYDDSTPDAVIGMTPMQEDDFTEELADIIIRTLDIAGAYGLDLGNAVVAKIEKNLSRPPKHNKRY